MIRLFIPAEHTGSERAVLAALAHIPAEHGIAEIVATALEGAPRYAVGWAMVNRVSYRLCVPTPMDTDDPYVLEPLEEEPQATPE